MQQFRKFVRGPLGKVLLALIVVPFVITGFYGYFESQSSDSAVAEVNGKPISSSLLEQRVRQMRDQVLAQSPQLDPAMVESFVSAPMVLQSLINNELMVREAKQSGMMVSVDQVNEIIVKTPQFQEDGRYSSRAFERFVRDRGMSPRGFITSLRSDMVMYQLRAAISNSDFALPFELKEQRRLGEQERDIRFARRDASALAKNHQVEPEAVEAYYQEHVEEFMRPKRYRLAYVELTEAPFREQVTVSDEDVRREYEARRAAMEMIAERSQRREIAHIQIRMGDARNEAEARQLAAAIQERLEGGESFADVAREVSEDPGSAESGGLLGEVSAGDLPEAMADAVASLEVGQVSAPVVVDDSLHIIKVMDARKREIPSLDEMRDSIRADLVRGGAESLLSEQAVQLEELAYEHPDLQQPAEELGLEVKTTDWFTLAEPSEIAAIPQVAQALRSDAVMKDRLNSELLEAGGNRYLVVRVHDTQPAEPIPLAEVRDEIAGILRQQRAVAELDAQETALREKLAADAGFEELASGLGKIEDAAGITRQDSKVARELITAAFTMPRPAEDVRSTKVIRLADGDLALVELQAVRDGGANTLNGEQRAVALAELASVEGERSLRQSLGLLRDEADIEVYEGRLGTVGGMPAE